MKVVHFHRRPFTDTFSIETLFKSLRIAMAQQDVVPEVQQAPHYSKGVWPRVQNALWARRHQGDVNHITGDVHYLTNGLDPARTILTIHDLFLFDRLQGIRRRLYKQLWFDIPVRQAKFVTLISEATKRELLRHVAAPRANLVVIPDIVGPQFEPVPRAYHDDLPIILHIGTKVNKNLQRLILALRGLRCRLHLVGVLTPELRAQLADNRIDYFNTSNLTDQQVFEAYRDCDLVSFASLYEGFGMPIIEGQTVERPVLTSNCSSMPEVAGSGALLVDPYDVGSIRRGLSRILTDRALRDDLIAAGRENCQRFAPNAVARQYIELYNQVAPGILPRPPVLEPVSL